VSHLAQEIQNPYEETRRFRALAQPQLKVKIKRLMARHPDNFSGPISKIVLAAYGYGFEDGVDACDKLIEATKRLEAREQVRARKREPMYQQNYLKDTSESMLNATSDFEVANKSYATCIYPSQASSPIDATVFPLHEIWLRKLEYSLIVIESIIVSICYPSSCSWSSERLRSHEPILSTPRFLKR
jgi:hypothetical protein